MIRRSVEGEDEIRRRKEVQRARWFIRVAERVDISKREDGGGRGRRRRSSRRFEKKEQEDFRGEG
jgi:hypothetical protein